MLRKGSRVLRREGAHGLAQRVVRRAYRSLGAGALEFPLSELDVVDPTAVPPVVAKERTSDKPVVGWLTAPPSLGSGGHTTMFRMIQGLEAAGVPCVLFLYDRYGGYIAEQEHVVRRGWPEVRAEVRTAEHGISGVDLCFATSWDTAHVLVARGGRSIRRMYFIQDFEPYFYPRGSLYSFAEDSYRFGFRHVALGKMVANTIEAEIGADSDVVPFGCDNDTYHLLPEQDRSGVVFYCKPGVARRGYPHVQLALKEFHLRHPDQEIHVYGDKVVDLDAPVTWHGRLWPAELNVLYNRTLGGIAMSFTNVTLVAGEMLAAGNIPVVNDSSLTRPVLDNPHVAWARSSPVAIADALSRVVECADPQSRARAAANSIQTGWGPTQSAVLTIVRDEFSRL